MSNVVDLKAYLECQRAWSEKTFGPGLRTGGITKHIEKELAEIRAKPQDLIEWIDVVILALDGAWRAGYTPNQIIEALLVKQRINLAREYPMPSSQDVPAEHDRSKDRAPATQGEYLDRQPACDISGTCVAPKDARAITNCVHCGKELHRHGDGQYYTWDAYKHENPRPQAQE